jgi:hypothetical protein
MRIFWLKILAIVVGITLFENITFPIGANHGRIDVYNESMQPYLFLAALAFISLILLLVIVYKIPTPSTGLYNAAKVIVPIAGILLIVNTAGWIPLHLTLSSILILILHLFGIVISLSLTISFYLNKKLSS